MIFTGQKLILGVSALSFLLFGGLVTAQPVPDPSPPAPFVRIHVDPAPEGEPLSTHFRVTVGGPGQEAEAPVYIAKVRAIAVVHPEVQQDGEAGFASFDMGGEGPVSVTIACLDGVHQVKVLPSSQHVTATLGDHSVTLVISKPGQYTVEIDGDWNNSLHLFANPLETDLPNPADPNVIYFGPGVHQIDPLQVHSNQTVYLAGGAVIYGKPTQNGTGAVFDLEGSHIILRGRGIIDGSLIPKPGPVPHLLHVNGNDIRVEGVILRDSGSWTFPIDRSDGVQVRNLKIFGWRGNSDGIDIVSSRQIDVSDCFLRTFDDLIVVKTYGKGAGQSRDITVERCVLWNEIAHALSLGAELRDPLENITFSDCDIIHDKGREWLLRVYNCDEAPVRHIVFDNIRIEEARRLFSLWIGKAVWSRSDERGYIDDITFRNITSAASESKTPAVGLLGFDAEHAIHQVEFDQVVIGGQPLAPGDVNQNDFVGEVRIQP